MEEMLNKHFSLTDVGKKIKRHFGPAERVIGTIAEDTYDLIFIDADKKNNFLYFELTFDKVRSGGLIIIDNVLWKGKVYGAENDADTHSFRKLNDQITADPRVEKLILPVRDGLLVIQKK
jgi:caffeoyl-CoA O-methyltransferase